MDALGGFPDGPDGRWQPYPDRGERGAGYEPEPARERGHDRGRDAGRGYDPIQARDFDRDDYRVPEPRFGDWNGQGGEPEQPYGPPERPSGSWAFDPDSREVPPREGFVPEPDRGAGFGRDQGSRGSRAEGGQRGVELDEGARGRDASGPVIPPPVAPAAPADFHLTQQIDRDQLRRPSGPPAPGPTVYRSRRPGLIILLAMGCSVIELLLLFVLVHAMFADKFAAGGVVSSIFALLGVPLSATGFYALVTGAPAVSTSNPFQGWFRAPTAYLPVGLVLLVAAALAAR